MPHTHSPILTVITRAARKAGIIALRHFDRRHELTIREKHRHDFVSEADTNVEKEILYHLRKAYPQYGVLAEESSSDKSLPQGWYWIIDPIDGTTNFLRGISHFAISIALAQDNDVMAGAVFDPVLDELFTAERGRGAFLNDHRLRVASTTTLTDAFLATGFPVRDLSLRQRYLPSFAALLTASGPGLRRSGCAALELAYTAAGRFDGFWELGLSPWDIAAGVLLVREAGGFVSDLNGGNGFLGSGDVVAANPILHAELLATVQRSGLSSPSGG
ncbi:MAG: inositol monophosphatase [Magnetococcales bacterium]|nr:inositol monophosphatase [Magnetococcales bacterium]